MAYRLSLLDKALIPQGVSTAQSLGNTVALAQRAEELGYHRYWFAEHHGIANLGSSAPEALAAFVLARTSRIRVGTGGVMLQHYAPYKVAETFNLLSTLAPGRVDQGIGRAPGGMPQATRALRSLPAGSAPVSFAEKLQELEAFLTASLPEDHEFAGAVATPQAPAAPERILLGSSVESAETAARLGWSYCYAGHFDGDPDRIGRVFETYRAITGRTPLLAVVAFVAPTDEEARRLVGSLKLYRVRLSNGQTVNVGDLAMAEEFARQSGVSDYKAEEVTPSVLAGTARHVRAELDRLHARHGVEEFVVDSPVPGFAERLASLEDLAREVFETFRPNVPQPVPA